MSAGAAAGAKKNRPKNRIPVDWSRGLASTSVDSTMKQSDVIGFDNARCMLTKLENSHNQPFVIYLTGEGDDAQKTQRIVDAAFGDERIGVAAQVICMIQSPGEHIDESHPFYRHVPGDTLPRLAFFAGDGTKIGQIDGSTTSVEVLKLMEQSFEESYDADFDRLFKAYQKLLTSMDMLRDKRDLLDDQYLTAETRAKERALDKKIAAIEDDADSLRKQKEKLLALKRRWS